MVRALGQAGSGEGVDLVDVAAGDAEGGVVAADGFFVGAVEQAVNLAFGVVVELELADAELVGASVAGVVGDLVDRVGGQLQIRVEVHETGHCSKLPGAVQAADRAVLRAFPEFRA